MIGQAVAKKRLSLGVRYHFKRLVDAWDCGAPDPIISDADLRDVVWEKSNILLIGPWGVSSNETGNWNKIVIRRVFPGLRGRTQAALPRFPPELEASAGEGQGDITEKRFLSP